MALFSYIKHKHSRRLNPGPFLRYQTYKKYLKEEFDEKCIYCLTPSIIKGYENFAVEHYFPKEDFKSLENEYSNLYFSCSNCNSYKGTYFPKTKEEKSRRFIPNPCEHIMFQHLKFIGVEVDARSEPGEFAVELLHLNDKKFQAYRDLVFSAKIGIEESIKSFKQTIKLMENYFKKDLSENKRQQLEVDLAKHKERLKNLKETLSSINK